MDIYNSFSELPGGNAKQSQQCSHIFNLFVENMSTTKPLTALERTGIYDFRLLSGGNALFYIRATRTKGGTGDSDADAINISDFNSSSTKTFTSFEEARKWFDVSKEDINPLWYLSKQQ